MRPLILMAHHAVFVIKAVIRTGIVRAVQKAIHLIFVEVDHTHITVIVVVIDIVRAGLAVGYLLFHRLPPDFGVIVHCKLCTVAETELVEQRTYIVADSSLAEEKPSGYLLVA